jgi:membrane protease YdiL (CAAX protease family)
MTGPKVTGPNVTGSMERGSSEAGTGPRDPGRPVDGPPAATGTGTGGDIPPRRPGSGAGDRPGLGWTELAVSVPVLFLLLFVVGLTGIVSVMIGHPDMSMLAGLYAAALATTALVALAVRVRDLHAVGLRSTGTGWLLVAVCAGVATQLMVLVAGLGYSQLVGGQGLVGSSDALPGGPLAVTAWVLTAGVLLPFASELLFRGIGYGALRRYGVLAATLGSAVLFAAVHGPTAAAVEALVLGVVAAQLYERSGSLWPAVAAHTAFSLTGFALTGFALTAALV